MRTCDRQRPEEAQALRLVGRLVPRIVDSQGEPEVASALARLQGAIARAAKRAGRALTADELLSQDAVDEALLATLAAAGWPAR